MCFHYSFAVVVPFYLLTAKLNIYSGENITIGLQCIFNKLSFQKTNWIGKIRKGLTKI